MATFHLLLFIPIVMAKINIELTGTYHETDPNFKLYLSGNDISLISDDDMQSFKLTDDNLKMAVKEYFGQEPSDVFLRSPTPWGDLYKSLQWQPITRIITANNGRILKITSKNETILEQKFENHAKEQVTYNVGVTKTAENQVKSVWLNDRLSVIDDVSYDIDVDSAGKRTDFGYTAKWGHDSEQGQFITIGTPELKINLKPYQTVTTKLQATKVEVVFEVEYASFLKGYLATNFAKGHDGHNFWGLDISAVMGKGDLKNEILTKEEIEFTFYVNPKMIVIDNETGAKLMEVAC